jgi:hypothetical protein
MPPKSSTNSKIVCYSPRKRPEMNKSTSFDEYKKSPQNHPRTPKQCAIAHENDQKWPNNEFWWLLEIPMKMFGPQKVCYSPRKLSEMTKSTRFDDCQNCPPKSSPDPKTVCYITRKRTELARSTSFDDCEKCPWNQPRTPKQDATAHKNCLKGPNQRVLTTAKMPTKSSPDNKTVCYSTRKRP